MAEATSSRWLVGTDSWVGGERLTMAAANQEATIPATTQFVRLAAEGGDLRYELSPSVNATATSVGFLPQGAVEILNLESGAWLSIYGAVNAFADLLYTKKV